MSICRILAPIGAMLAMGAIALPALAMDPGFTPVYGSPQAQVTDTAYHGPYTTGDELSRLPDIKPAVDAKIHTIRMDITHKWVEIDKGIKFEAWTFGDTVPGPVIHIRQGDRVKFTMTNRTDETANVAFPFPHSIDFHSAMVNPIDKYRTIYPGQSINFEWSANYPGVFMYHCGTPMLLHHMTMGLYGAVVVDPIGGWPGKVDREYVVVQSEFYTKPKDRKNPKLVEDDTDGAMRGIPSYVVFNGKVGELAEHPLKARPGERVRLYVLNAGPCNTSSFHVVGTIFDKVYPGGNPANVLRGMQTALLGSADATVVEFVVPEAGRYPFVDHEFNHASKGAIGFVDATEDAKSASR